MRRFAAMFAFLIAVSLLDVVTTLRGLGSGAGEFNPMMAATMHVWAHQPIIGLLFLKFVLLAVPPIYGCFRGYVPATRLCRGFVLAFSVVVVWNLHILAMI